MNQNVKVKEKAFEVVFDKTNKYVYQPTQPFRLSGCLVWEPKGYITSLTIDNIEQLVQSVHLQYFEAPFPIEHARAAIEQNMLSRCLPNKFKGLMFKGLMFQTCKCSTCITIQGSFRELMFWGIECYGI